MESEWFQNRTLKFRLDFNLKWIIDTYLYAFVCCFVNFEKAFGRVDRKSPENPCIDKILKFWPIHYFNPQFLNFFGFVRSVGFAWCIIYHIWMPVGRFNPIWYGGGVESTPLGGFSSTVPKRLALESWNFLTFNIYLWVIVCNSFHWYVIYYVTMATLLLNRGRTNLVKNDKEAPLFLSKSICMAKLTWNMKSASQKWPLHQISA